MSLGIGFGPAMTSGFNDPAKSLTYLDTPSTSDVGSTASATVNIGEPSEFREIFIVACIRNGRTALSATVNGYPLTKATGTFVGTVGGQTKSIALFYGVVPFGSGNVTASVTYDNSITAPSLSFYKVLNRKRQNTDSDDTTTTTSSSNKNTTSTTTIEADGFWFGCCSADAGNIINGAPSGATEDFRETNANRVSFCSRSFQSSQTTPTDEWSMSGSVASVAVTWSFR